MPRDHLGRFTPLPSLERLTRRLDRAQALCDRAIALDQSNPLLGDQRLMPVAQRFARRVLTEVDQFIGTEAHSDA